MRIMLCSASAHWRTILLLVTVFALAQTVVAQRTVKPVLHGRHWVAITGKPLGATAGAMIFQKGGNAVDAACAMLGAVSTMWDTLGWGGETQALIYNPQTKKVIGINALGVAPTGATPEFFKGKGMKYPPATRAAGGRHARHAGRPDGHAGRVRHDEPEGRPRAGHPDGGRLPDRAAAGRRDRARQEARSRSGRTRKAVMLPHLGEAREAPQAGEIFRQADLAATLRKLVEAEQQALKAGKSRKDAIYAAYDRFYKGDIAARVRARIARAGRPAHDGGPGRLEGPHRRAGR